MLYREAKKSAMPSGLVAGTTADTVQPRSSENSPISTAPMSVSNRMVRPAASQAARAEPTPTATEKMVRKTVTTPSEPPMSNATSGGNSDNTSAPTSQNQLATIAPHHSRASARTYLIRAAVETKMLRLMTSPGAPSPGGGMYRLEIQLASAVTIMSQAKWMGLLVPLAAMPAVMVPSRMARKVPPSISALPAGSSLRAR